MTMTRSEHSIITLIRASKDSSSFINALIELINCDSSDTKVLRTTEVLELVLQKSSLCYDGASASSSSSSAAAATWFGSALLFFSRDPSVKKAASSNTRLREAIFNVVLRGGAVSNCDSARSIASAMTELTFKSDDAKRLFCAPTTSSSDARKVFVKLVQHATTPRSIRFVLSWFSNCCVIDDGKKTLGIGTATDAKRKKEEDVAAALTRAVAQCTSSADNLRLFWTCISRCAVSPSFLSDGFIQDTLCKPCLMIATSNNNNNIVSVDELKEEPAAVEAFFRMMSTLMLLSKAAGRSVFLANKKTSKIFHDAIVRVAQSATTNIAVSSLCRTICLLTNGNDDAKILLASNEVLDIYTRVAPFVSSHVCIQNFLTAIANTNVNVVDNKKKFSASPKILNAILTVSRLIYSSNSSNKSTAITTTTTTINNNNADEQHTPAELISWFRNVVLNISTIVEGKKLFGTSSKFVTCWVKLAAHAKGSSDAVRSMCKILNSLCSLPAARPLFATDAVVQRLESFSLGISASGDDIAAAKLGAALASLSLDKQAKTVLSRQSMFEALIRIAQSAAACSADGARYLCQTIANCCTVKDGPGRSVFACPKKLVREFIAVLAPHATSSRAAHSLCNLIANTTADDKSRAAYIGETNIQSTVDVLFAVSPFCRSAKAVKLCCKCISNLCIVPDTRQLFQPEAELVKNYTMFVQFLSGSSSSSSSDDDDNASAASEAAEFWAKSLWRLVADKNQRAALASSSKKPSMKNAICAAVLIDKSAFLNTKSDASVSAAGYLIKVIDRLLSVSSSTTKAVFCTTSFRRALHQVSDFLKKTSAKEDKTIGEVIDKCKASLEKEAKKELDYVKDDSEITKLIKEIQNTRDPPSSLMDSKIIRIKNDKGQLVPVTVKKKKQAPTTAAAATSSSKKTTPNTNNNKTKATANNQKTSSSKVKPKKKKNNDDDDDDDSDSQNDDDDENDEEETEDQDQLNQQEEDNNNDDESSLQEEGSAKSSSSHQQTKNSAALASEGTLSVPVARCFSRGVPKDLSFKECLTNALTILNKAPPGRPDLLEWIPTKDDLDSLLFYLDRAIVNVKNRPAVKKLIETVKLTDDHIKVLMLYKLENPYPFYRWLNGWLSSADRDGDVKTAIGPIFTLMHRAMERIPKVTTRGVRSIIVRNIPSLLETFKNYSERLQHESKISFWAFSSFSTDDGVINQEHFVGKVTDEAIVYQCPKLEGVLMDDFKPDGLADEKEVLPLCPALFEVVSSVKVGQKLVVCVNQINNKELAYVEPSC